MPLKRVYVIAAERALGHPLPKGAEVHHVDCDRSNNRNDNLCILQSRAEHFAVHRRLRVLKAGGNPWTQQICCICKRILDISEFCICKRILDISEFGKSRSRRDGILNYCRECARNTVMAIYNRKQGRPDNWRETPERRQQRNREMANRRWQKAG